MVIYAISDLEGFHPSELIHDYQNDKSISNCIKMT